MGNCVPKLPFVTTILPCCSEFPFFFNCFFFHSGLTRSLRNITIILILIGLDRFVNSIVLGTYVYYGVCSWCYCSCTAQSALFSVTVCSTSLMALQDYYVSSYFTWPWTWNTDSVVDQHITYCGLCSRIVLWRPRIMTVLQIRVINVDCYYCHNTLQTVFHYLIQLEQWCSAFAAIVLMCVFSMIYLILFLHQVPVSILLFERQYYVYLTLNAITVFFPMQWCPTSRNGSDSINGLC